ncbi:MAG: hypothetical protein Q9198_001728 [Flavoplaca austrocitrina]
MGTLSDTNIVDSAKYHPVVVEELSRGKYLHSERLPELLQTKQDYVQALEPFDFVLQLVELELHRLTVATSRSSIDHKSREEVHCVVLSIRVLAHSLWCTRRNRPEHAAPTIQRDHGYLSAPGNECVLLRQRMRIDDGWCRAVVSQILTSYTASAAYYLSSIPRARGVNIQLHLDCTDSECQLIVDEDNYQQSHSGSCCGPDCRMVEAPLNEVLDIIEQGGIPLMKLVDGTLKVRKADFNVDYTAITHVWSGGLGNPNRNAMWLCQLKNLTNLPRLSGQEIASHDPSLGPACFFPKIWETFMDPSRLQSDRPLEWFWIDTLCIPRTTNKTDREYIDRVWDRRQDSINRMTQTYAGASSVIVLDTELQDFNLRTAGDSVNHESDMLAAFARTLCSGWMTRCWTYQEAAMASHLLVQHRDGPFALSVARAEVMQRNERLLRASSYSQLDDMMDEMSAWFSRLPGTRDNQLFRACKAISKSSPEVFTQIWNDLGMRTTSRPVDRIQIFSLLVNISPTDLLKLPKNVRLKAIIKSQLEIPLALLFQRPLTEWQLEENARQRRIEEIADQDRGFSEQHVPVDETDPLPTIIQSESLPRDLGWMKQDENRAKYLYFTTDLMDEGTKRISLFSMGYVIIRNELRYTLYDRTSNVYFEILFGSERDRSLASRGNEVFLLVSSEMRLENFTAASFREHAALLLRSPIECHGHEGRSDHSNNVRRFQRLCPVICRRHESQALPRHEINIFAAVRHEWNDECEYRIDCDLSQVGILPNHRIMGFADPDSTMFVLSATITPLLFFYYLVFLGLTAPAAFTHGPATFPPGFFALIAFLFVMRMLAFVWNSLTKWGAKADAIIFNDWVNGLFRKEDMPPTINRRRHHTGVSVHMTLGYTVVFGGFCTLFLVLGAVFFHNRNTRWLIPLGVAGLLELLLRYAAETLYPKSTFLQSIIGPPDMYGKPDYPGFYQNYFAESRLTRWARELRK